MKNVTIYNKAVRDKQPEIIRGNGHHPHVLTLEPDDFNYELGRKLSEEATEYQEAEPANQLEELADVLAVVRALAPSVGGWQKLLQAEAAKAMAKGVFDKRQYLVTVVVPE